MVEQNIQTLLNKYIQDPLNPESNFWLAWEYDKIGQNAPALSYYLRCAELSDDPNLVNECLIKTWLMVNRTTRRPAYEYNQLLTAITQNPKRPEAYFFLSRLHSSKSEWKQAYYYASAGLELCDFELPAFNTEVEYKGKIGLLFQKAYTSWYVGQRDEAKNLWKQVYQSPDTPPDYLKTATENLLKFGIDIKQLNKSNDNQKIDIVLQGQYSAYALETAKSYLELSFVNKVIISCWQTDTVPIVVPENIQIIQNPLPKVNGTGNRNLQIVSSYGGLSYVTSTYAVKMRNDQRYDLQSMEKMYLFFNENKERLITFENDETRPKNRILVGGMFEGFPFHPRDHIFWGHIDDLKDIFDMPLEPRGIEDIVHMKREDYWKYYDCYIRTESYIGSHYCSKFNEKIKKYLLKPDQYLFDGAPKYNEALHLSETLSKQVFKSFPRKDINLEWDKYNWSEYPYNSQYNRFNERWHENGY